MVGIVGMVQSLIPHYKQPSFGWEALRQDRGVVWQVLWLPHAVFDLMTSGMSVLRFLLDASSGFGANPPPPLPEPQVSFRASRPVAWVGSVSLHTSWNTS